jgi:hypothetical protein
MDVSFRTPAVYLSARSPVDAATGMPTPGLRISIGPIMKVLDQRSPQIRSAAIARAPLTQAVFAVLGPQGAAGITIWLKAAQITGDQLSASDETITLSAGQLTITDIGSGRTASTP